MANSQEDIQMHRCGTCKQIIKSKDTRCKICCKKYMMAYFKTHKADMKNTSKKWRDSHRAHILSYQKHRYDTIPNVRIMATFYSSLRRVIKNERSGKKFVKKLGLNTRDELIAYLISTIPKGYSLADYGQILHVDHIKPACSFDLTVASQRSECFHYTNIRFVCRKTNEIKSSKDKLLSLRSL